MRIVRAQYLNNETTKAATISCYNVRAQSKFDIIYLYTCDHAPVQTQLSHRFCLKYHVYSMNHVYSSAGVCVLCVQCTPYSHY